MKKIIIVLMIILTTLSFANPNINKPWNYSLNPALMDYGTRNFLDLGINGDISLFQPFINFSDLFKEEIVVDFNEIYDNLDNENLPITLNANASIFGKLHIWFLTYANNVNLYSNTKINLPNDLVKLISYGNVENGEIVNLDGEGIFNSNIILENTNYISIGKNSIFGFSFSKFIPVSILKSTMSFNQDSNVASATTTINYSIEGNIHSSLESLSSFVSKPYNGPAIDEDILNAFNDSAGLKINLGYINKSNKWGISINDIVLKPAEMTYKYTFSATGNILIDNMNIITEQSSPTLEKSEESIARKFPDNPLDLPMNISAFYTFNFIFDITPHIQYYFGKGLDWGVNLDGNLFFIPFWLDISNKIDYWSLNTGLGLNIHIIDINASVNSNSNKLGNILNFDNLSFNLNIGMGI
ncbi:hypothetical protein JCM30566_07370 [Marinitoga arctica]